MKIVVTGSLGNISKPLAEILIAQGHSVTVVSSKPEKQIAITAMGATAAIGSVDDPAFLTATFAGHDSVYCMVPPNFGEQQADRYRRIAGNYAAAIGAAGIKQVVHLSSYGAHLPQGTGIIQCSHFAEGILNQLGGIAVTHLRPGYFYYNLFSFISMIKGAGFIGSNYGGDDILVLVSPKDIAVAAAHALTTPATGQSTQSIQYVASDERTCTQIAEALGAAIGIPGLKWITMTDQQVYEALANNGISANMAEALVQTGAATHSGILRTDYELRRPELGKVKLEDFAVDFAALYHQK
jgi:uncharacterized protein YbjT (DUF2867 family)